MNDPEISSQFYRNFQYLCSQHGMSIRGVCNAIGISPSTTVRWKNGASPDVATLKKIADYFCVSINDVIGFQQVGDTSMLVTEKESRLIIAYHMMSDTDRQIVDMLVAKYNTDRMFRSKPKKNED